MGLSTQDKVSANFEGAYTYRADNHRKPNSLHLQLLELCLYPPIYQDSVCPIIGVRTTHIPLGSAATLFHPPFTKSPPPVMDFKHDEPLTKSEKCLLVLLFSIVVAYAYSEVRTWHVSEKINSSKLSVL